MVARVLAIGCALVLLPALAAVAQNPRGRSRLPEGVKAHLDLEYARAGDKSLTLDLYLPDSAKDNERLPVIVWIHGGAWLGGSKEGGPAIRMATRGYAVASINYRLSQEAVFPAQIEDCKAAIRWLRAHTSRYGLDGGRIGAWGSSAGGHLVALLGTSGDVKELEGQGGPLNHSSRVQAVCDFFGPTNFLAMGGSHDGPNSPESRLVGGAIQENKEKVAKANPITYVTADDPPFLIMHGDKDTTVPINQSELLHEALNRAGVPAQIHVVKGAGHGFGGPDIDRKVNAFFDENLRNKEPSADKE